MSEQKKGDTEMSAEKRKKILIGAGGTAVVLAAAIAYLSPNFPYRSEDASGAIGAVQKHRAPQITQQDVVLGDEAVKQEQKILYADYLDEAATLRNVGAELAAAAQSVEARSRLGNVEQQLAARQNDLKARYIANAEQALAAMNRYGAFQSLAAQDFHKALAAQDFQALAAQDFHKALAAMEALAAKAKLASNDLGPENVQKLASVEQQLGAYTASLQNEAALAATPQLVSLRNAVEAENLGMRLRAYAESLEARAKQARAYYAAQQALEARKYDSLGKASQDLMLQAQSLEARALQNMENAMMARAAEIEQLGRMSQTLKQAENALAARSKQIGSQELAKSQQELAAFGRGVLAQQEQLAARSRYNAASLEAFSNHLANVEQLQQRTNLASAAGDTQMLAQRARELANRLASQQRE